MSTWIVCPNLVGARLFHWDNPENGPRFVREYPRPKVQVHATDLPDEDEQEEDEHVISADELKKELAVAREYSAFLAMLLEHAFEKSEFSDLILAAEPQFLEIFESKLSERVRERIIGRIQQDLYEVNESDLEPYVEGFVKKAA